MSEVEVTVLGVTIDDRLYFRRLAHSLLVGKLEHFGIENKALQFFSSYLSHRHQYVDFEGARCETLG